MNGNILNPAFQEINDAAKGLENILEVQMQKKREGTLEPQYSRSYQTQIQESFNRIVDLHMIAHSTTSESKQLTTDAKVGMNEKRVELQDVMYERRHILEEIMQCRQFRSVYQDVELIPLDEFQAKAGPEYLENSDNPHQLMINRLKYELVVRSALKEQKEALDVERTKLIKENRKIQKKVDQFDKLLDDFVLSAAPVEEALQAQMKAQVEDMDIAEANEAKAEDTTTEVMDTTL